MVDNPSIVDRSISYVDEIKLNHDQSMFSFEFVTLSYVDRNSISYRYILEGYEEQWHFNGVNRLASYTNVPSGNYVFRVQAMDDNGVDSFRSVNAGDHSSSLVGHLVGLRHLCLLGAGVLYMGIRLSVFLIRMRNNVYIDQRLSELKYVFHQCVARVAYATHTDTRSHTGTENRGTVCQREKYVELMERILCTC